MSRPLQAKTLEELREILTPEIWVPYCPDFETNEECVITAMHHAHISQLCIQLTAAIPDLSPLGEGKDIVEWNDKQENLEAVHAVIDKAIVIRDQEAL